MRSFLFYILILCTRSITSKLINSNNVSLTTELIPNFDEAKASKHKRNHVYDLNRLSNDEDKPESDPSQADAETGNDRSLSNNGENNYESEGNLPTKVTQSKSCIICPFRMKTSVTKALKHTYRGVKLFVVPSKLAEKYVGILYFTTALSSVFSLVMVALGCSDQLFDELRANWAFQGEMSRGSVEAYTKLGMYVFSADLLFKMLVLRLVFFAKLNKSNFLEKLNWMGTNLGSAEHKRFNKALAGFTNAFVLTKFGFMTFLHYLFMKSNWNTGSFLLDQEATSQLSNVVLLFLAVGVFEQLVSSLDYSSLSEFLHVEHLLDPLKFRSKSLNRARELEWMDAFHSLPAFLQRFADSKTRYLLKLKNFNEGLKRIIPLDLEWVFLLLNTTMALSSNSAAGMYLVAWQYFAALLADLLNDSEKDVLSKISSHPNVKLLSKPSFNYL